MVYPDGMSIAYQRDTQGRITGITASFPGGECPDTILLRDVQHAPFGPATGWTFGSDTGGGGSSRSSSRGTTSLCYSQSLPTRYHARTLDLDYRPLSISGPGGGLSLGYEFNPAGNLTRLYNADRTVSLARYDYDGRSRLEYVKDGPTGSTLEQYGYDDTGNRTSLFKAGTTTAYTYPTTNHRLQSVGGVARTYDATGNTLGIGGAARGYVYNDANRMSQAKVNGAVTMDYAYNGRGEQVRKYLGSKNSTYTVYDEAGRWLGDYASSGVPIQQVVWLDDLPVIVLSAGKLHYIEPDHLGTPRVVVDPARGVPVWKWDLQGEAFGNTVPNQDPDLDGTQLVFNMRYPGQRYDAASGLNYSYFRDYEASTGRYSQSDPIGQRGGVSTYGYALQSPPNAIDPSGLAAYLTPMLPANQRAHAGPYCVDGVIRPYFNYAAWPKDYLQCKEIEGCLAVHEYSHAADAYRSSPGLCRKHPLHFILGTTPMSVAFPIDTARISLN